LRPVAEPWKYKVRWLDSASNTYPKFNGTMVMPSASVYEMATDCEVVEGRTLRNWGEAFKSIVGNGTASIIDNLDEARQGLALLMKQQAGMEHVEFTDQQVHAVTVWKVEADYLTAKVREKPQPHMH